MPPFIIEWDGVDEGMIRIENYFLVTKIAELYIILQHPLFFSNIFKTSLFFISHQLKICFEIVDTPTWVSSYFI